MNLFNWLFPKRYYLVFIKKTITGPAHNAKNGSAVTALYRKKDKNGKMKFFIDYQLRSTYLVSYWKAKYYMMLIRIYGKKNTRLFAYALLNGTVDIKKVEIK